MTSHPATDHRLLTMNHNALCAVFQRHRARPVRANKIAPQTDTRDAGSNLHPGTTVAADQITGPRNATSAAGIHTTNQQSRGSRVDPQPPVRNHSRAIRAHPDVVPRHGVANSIQTPAVEDQPMTVVSRNHIPFRRQAAANSHAIRVHIQAIGVVRRPRHTIRKQANQIPRYHRFRINRRGIVRGH